MIKNKSCVIIATICLIVGLTTGIGGLFLYQKNQTKDLEKNITIETIVGEYGDIFHTDLINKKETIEFKTVSKKPGKIKTVIKKKDFCPKIYKNSLSFILGAGIVNSKPIISYGAEYRRNIFTRFHILTGARIDFESGKIYHGFQIFVGAGLSL